MAVMFGLGVLAVLVIAFVGYMAYLMNENVKLRREVETLRRANETLQREKGHT
jgi:hypothetical protein